MVTRRRLRSFLNALALYTIAALLIGYFGVNAYTGEHGLIAKRDLDQDIAQLNLELGAVTDVPDAWIEVSESPHLGCEKFVSRFGAEAMRFVNGRVGRQLRLRGLNARVLVPGMVRVGDRVRRTRQAPDMTSAIVASRSSST